MTIDLPGGRRLVLAGGGWAGFWLAAGAVALVLLVVLYRAERRLVSRSMGLFLLGSRLLAALALMAMLLEPIAARTVREQARGRLIVAADNSESMATTDPARAGEDRARLLRALGLSPAEPLDAFSRREVARRLVAGERAPLAALGWANEVVALAFAREPKPVVDLAALGEALRSPPMAGDPVSDTTDWLPVLDEALRLAARGDRPLLGVVLLTDGRANGPGDVAGTLDRLAARGVPIYPVLVGSTHPPIDAAVASVEAPDSIYKGDTATITATLALNGQAGREVEVTLERPGAPPLRQTARVPTDGTRPRVVFRVPMEEPGTVPLTVAISPQPGDVRPDNDRRALTLRVTDDKARVLLVDGEARWEFRYLRNALARDPRVEVDAIVFHQPRSGLGSEGVPTYGTALPPPPSSAEGASPTPDPLGAFDVIVLGDVEPGDLSSEAWTRLEAYVSGRGGTLVLASGPRSWASMATRETARKLLPVVDPRVVPVDIASIDPDHPGQPPGTRFVPTTQALGDPTAWPMLQLGSSGEESRRRWMQLPRLPWMLAGQSKPGASTLATAGEETSAEPPAAVLAAQPYGLGKVIWLGFDGTWRWRHRVGDAYHHRFWGQLARWAASGKLAAGNAQVRFGPLRGRVAEGEPIKIQARIGDDVAGVGPESLLAARIFKASGTSATGDAVAVVPLRPVPGQPRAFEGQAPGLPAGAYAIRLDAPGLSQALGLDVPNPPEAALAVVPRDSTERVELAAAREPLERLATATQGRVFAESEAESLASLLQARPTTIERVEETPLWDQPYALLAFVAILTIEWVARKHAGLP